MTQKIEIAGSSKHIGADEVFVIAEIGKNYIQTIEPKTVSEYLANAIRLVNEASSAGADAVKFQTHVVEDEVYSSNFKSPHFDGADRYSWVKRNEDSTPLEDFWIPLKKHCDEKEIVFFSTPMSKKAAVKLDNLNVPLWKVGSGDVLDFVMLDYLARTKKPIIISTGMISLSELERLIRLYREKELPLVVLYCVSKYPCPQADFNLATIEYISEKYPDVIVGFSDHSVDSHDVDLAAVKLGAKVIEKHFSLDRNLWGSDHKASITPSEMSALVNDIKGNVSPKTKTEKFFGKKDRELEGAKNQFRPFFNKTLVAGQDLKEGYLINQDSLWAMRPRMLLDGLASEKYYEVLGKGLTRDVNQFEPIQPFLLN